MESRHFLKVGDIVEDRSGNTGRVIEGSALFAVVEWRDSRRTEVDQFDPDFTVVERGGNPV